MALICDTGGVYSLYDADDAGYAATTSVVESEAGPLLLPVILLAEIDYLLHSRLGPDAAFQFLEAVEQGDFTLVPLLDIDLVRCRELLVQYRDLEIGLADATIVAALSAWPFHGFSRKISATFARSNRAAFSISYYFPQTSLSS
jgi:predicted nucleic acid-binding protein